MTIMQPWPPDGTIMGGASAPRDTAPCDLVARGRPALDAEQLVDELRTIATCVLGFTELLRRASLEDHDRQVYLGVLHQQATRLARLVEQLDGATEASSDGVPQLPG